MHGTTAAAAAPPRASAVVIQYDRLAAATASELDADLEEVCRPGRQDKELCLCMPTGPANTPSWQLLSVCRQGGVDCCR
eukprot:355251-Chlamydomonas_euryale.AAC.5